MFEAVAPFEFAASTSFVMVLAIINLLASTEAVKWQSTSLHLVRSSKAILVISAMVVSFARFAEVIKAAFTIKVVKFAYLVEVVKPALFIKAIAFTSFVKATGSA